MGLIDGKLIDYNGKRLPEELDTLNEQLAEIATIPKDEAKLRDSLVNGEPVLLTSTITVTSTIEIPLDYPLYLDGQGKGKIIFTGTGDCIKATRVKKATIKGVEFVGNGQFNGQTAIAFRSPNDGDISSGSSSINVGQNKITDFETGINWTGVLNSKLEENRISKSRYGLILKGKCLENVIIENTIFSSFKVVSLLPADNPAVGKGVFVEGQYFYGNTFDTYDFASEADKNNIACLDIKCGYDIKFVNNYISNYPVNLGNIINLEKSNVANNQLFYISFIGNGIYGRSIRIAGGGVTLHNLHLIINANNIQLNNDGKFLAYGKVGSISITDNIIKVHHEKRCLDFGDSELVNISDNTIIYGGYLGSETTYSNLNDCLLNLINCSYSKFSLNIARFTSNVSATATINIVGGANNLSVDNLGV